jgi:hypothetical protein
LPLALPPCPSSFTTKATLRWPSRSQYRIDTNRTPVHLVCVDAGAKRLAVDGGIAAGGRELEGSQDGTIRGAAGGEPGGADRAAGRQAGRADVVVEGHALDELPADVAVAGRLRDRARCAHGDCPLLEGESGF